MASITDQLLASLPQELDQATRHSFLSAAARSSLPKNVMVEWLGQDRLYALSYIHFISSLMAQIPIPTGLGRVASLEWRIIDMLIDCLINIRREIALFEDTAKEHDFFDEISAATPSIATRAYQDLFAGACASNRPLLSGLVTLYATEECYLQAWSHAKQVMASNGSSQEGDVMQSVFIPNWSSNDFRDFVYKLKELTDEYGRLSSVDESMIQDAQHSWRQVLWAEKNFWPDVKA